MYWLKVLKVKVLRVNFALAKVKVVLAVVVPDCTISGGGGGGLEGKGMIGGEGARLF